MSIWVDKYKPTNTNDLIGQSRNVARIKSWLKSFDASNSQPLFIYGPPGIGKTTAAHLCCKECGYKTVEFNASDQRNKNIIRDVISEVAGTSRLSFTGRASEQRDAIILDEIDGMAGNEDRGGIAQLIIELKKTKKPMIFICNDGQHQKLRSLRDKCENIEFKKPESTFIHTLVKKVALIEKLDLKKINVDNLVKSTDYDIRQILNSLSLFRDGDSNQIAKTTRLNAFEASKKVLTASNNSIETRFECFFSDYSIMPLFMFENYIRNRPAKGDQLKAISRAADALCLSDLADKEIRSHQNWSLLQAQGLLSTVIPSKLVESHQVGRIEFPQFLGKLSNYNKRLRLVQELNAHMCLKVRGGIDADYLDVFRERLSAPLIKKEKLGGVEAVVEFMHDYCLLKEDIASIMELSSWSFKPDPMSKVDTKTKTALTNAYKKHSIALPYFVDDKPLKKRKPIGLDIEDDADGVEEQEEPEEEVKLKPKRVIKVADVKPTQSKKKGKETKKEKVVEKEEEAKNEKEGKKDKKSETEAPAATTRGRRKKQTADTTIAAKPEVVDLDESDEVQVINHSNGNGNKSENQQQPVADKRPPINGIARFFTAKRQRSS